MEKGPRFKPHTYPEEAPRGRILEHRGSIPRKSVREYIDVGLADVREKFNNLQERHEHADIAEALGELNETALKELFAEKVARAGRETHDLNFIPLKKIIFSANGEDVLGGYNSKSHEIVIHPDTLRADTGSLASRMSKFGDANLAADTKKLTKLQTIYTGIHEETHAVSFSGIRKTGAMINEDGSRTIRRETTASGYFRTDDNFYVDAAGNHEISGNECFRSINEGVTELIALDVMEEYARRVSIEGVSNTEVKSFVSFVKQKEGGVYSRNIRAVQIFAEIVAKATEVPSDIIIEAIVRGYLRGDVFIDEDMRVMLDEILGQDIGGYLLQFSEHDDILNFTNALSKSHIRLSDDIRQKLDDDFFG